MFPQFIIPFLKALLAIAIIAASMLFNANAQTTDQNKDNKIHLKITTETNGNRTVIDTTFNSDADANAFLKSIDKDPDDENDDYKIKNFSFNFKNDEINSGDSYFNLNMDIPNWSDEDRAKFESEMEKLKEEMKKENLFDMHWDTSSMGNSFNYNFNFRVPDEKELEALKEKFNDMKCDPKVFGFEFPPVPEMPPLPNFNYDVQGLTDADKKQFEEQMKRAEAEYEKAMELLKEKKGRINLPPPGESHYEFNFNDKTNSKTQKKTIIIEKSDAKTAKSKSSKKPIIKIEDGKSDNFKISILKYFPNPNNGKFDLSFRLPLRGDLNVTITNSAGNKIYNETLLDFTGDYSQAFDLTEHGAGVYLLHIQQGKEWLSKKVIVN